MRKRVQMLLARYPRSVAQHAVARNHFWLQPQQHQQQLNVYIFNVAIKCDDYAKMPKKRQAHNNNDNKSMENS